MLLLLLLPGVLGRAQATAQSASTETITGRVLNANSGAPIARVLVQLGQAAAFTDHDGKFALADVSASGGSVMLTKPGYFTSPERTDAPSVEVTSAQLTQPLELRLYPEALITGVVTSQDGAPISGVQVSAQHLATQGIVRRFETIASVETDSHGGFRLAVPAGDYQISTQFVATSAETGLSILPAVMPTGPGGGTFHLGSGEQQQIELRPHTGVPHTVGLSLQGLSDDRSPVVSVSTANGATWQMGADSEPDLDQTAIHLPAGSYHLSISSNNGESVSFGEARLTMPDHDIAGVAVQLAPVAPIPVEIRVDAQASTAAAPSPLELGLELIPEQQEHAALHEDTVHLQTRPGRGPMLLLHPGRFRLVAPARRSWYIESATYGGAEILGQSLTVAPGSGSPPLQLVVNNVVGSLEGKVSGDGSSAAAWVALLPTFPSAAPLTTLRAASDGTFSLSQLQPGNYLAFALQYRTGADLLDPAVRSGLGLRPQSVSIQPGTKATLELEVSGAGSFAP